MLCCIILYYMNVHIMGCCVILQYGMLHHIMSRHVIILHTITHIYTCVHIYIYIHIVCVYIYIYRARSFISDGSRPGVDVGNLRPTLFAVDAHAFVRMYSYN